MFRNKKCPTTDDNFRPHQKLSHSHAFIHADMLLTYLEKGDDRKIDQKMMRNLHSTIYRRVNEKQKQISMISFFTKQWGIFL